MFEVEVRKVGPSIQVSLKYDSAKKPIMTTLTPEQADGFADLLKTAARSEQFTFSLKMG